MKPIKMLGLIALAMAFVGVSSAMAESTALCKEDALGACPKGQLVTHVHEATLSGSKAKLLTSGVEADLGQHVHEATSSGSKAKLLSSLANVECDALFLGEVIESQPLEILGNFTYTNCKTEGGTGCTVVEASKDATINGSISGHELADTTYVYEVNFYCGLFINCTYNGEGLEGHALGPLLAAEENGEVRIEEQALKKVSGLLCPKKAKLDFLATPLSPTYIAEGWSAESTVLCNEDPGGSEGERCESVALVVECDVLFLGDVTSENSLGAPLVISGNFTYANCKTVSETACEVTETSTSATINVLKTGHELAEVKGTSEVNVHCGALINCTYNGVGLQGHALGPLLAAEKNGEVGIAKQTTNKTGGFPCPHKAELDIVTTPLEPTYIAK